MWSNVISFLAQSAQFVETQHCPGVKHGGGSAMLWEDPYSFRKQSYWVETVETLLQRYNTDP